MRVISRRNKTAKIFHPDDPSIFVVVVKLSRPDWMRHYSTLTNYQEIIVLTDKTGKPMMRPDGEPHIHTKQHFPIDVIISALEKIVINWSGLIDEETNEQIPFDKKNIELLMSDDLNFKTKKKVEKDGQEVEEEVETQFWEYVYEQAQKPETFDNDPKV
jgi:hypothetical protein